MIGVDFRETTGFAKNPSQPVAKQAIITFDAIGVLFSYVMFGIYQVLIEDGDKCFPIVGCDSVICNTEFLKSFMKLFSGFLAAIAYDIRNNFFGFAVISVNQPLFIGF